MFTLLKHPAPDFSRLDRVLRRQGEPDRVPFYELFADDEIIQQILDEPLAPRDSGSWEDFQAYLDQNIRFYIGMGYDFVPLFVDSRLRLERRMLADTACHALRDRPWRPTREGLICTMEDYERYPWPQFRDISWRAPEYLSAHLPDGAKLILMLPGIMELASDLMGTEELFLALADNPDVVRAVCRRIESLLNDMMDTAVTVPNTGAILYADDWGFRGGLLIPPHWVEELLLPCLERCCHVAHAHNLPLLFHSCGWLEEVMDRITQPGGIDARHSFEDALEPVEVYKRRWGDRVAVLGGVDVDLLARGDEPSVRRRTREILEACAPGGGFALGTGNTVANYIPVKNYLAMLEEGWNFMAQ